MNRIAPSELTSAQMSNAAYALLVRDFSSAVDRSRLDDILEGVISAPSSGPDLDTFDPAQTYGRDVDEVTLREQWGRAPDAIAGRQALSDFIEQVEVGGALKGTGTK